MSFSVLNPRCGVCVRGTLDVWFEEAVVCGGAGCPPRVRPPLTLETGIEAGAESCSCSSDAFSSMSTSWEANHMDTAASRFHWFDAKAGSAYDSGRLAEHDRLEAHLQCRERFTHVSRRGIGDGAELRYERISLCTRGAVHDGPAVRQGDMGSG